MKKFDPILPYLEKIKKKTESDHVLFAHSNDDCTFQVYDFENDKEKTLSISSHSLLEDSLRNKSPLIENNVHNSFFFDEKIDNPFDYEVVRYGILPLYTGGDTRRLLGYFMLYQTREDKRLYEKNTFSKLQIQCEKLVKKLSEINFWKKITEYQCDDSFSSSNEKDDDELNQAYKFFSSIVHDMRTPINATLGFLELIEDSIDTSQKEYVLAASRSAEMVASLVNDVLDFSKIKTGNLELDFHYFSPIDNFHNIAYTFYHMAWKKGVEFSIFFDPNIPFVIKSDPYRLKQIINNFLSNAIKFTPEKGYVDLSLYYDKESDKLIIDVKDTGIGIEQKKIEKIFEPFQQASKETSGKYGGTGLGLSISKYLAERLGAQITVNSELGKGSTFSISIPCHTIPGTPSSIYVDYNRIPLVSLVEGERTDKHHIHMVEKYFDMLNIPHEVIGLEALSEEVQREKIYLFSEYDYMRDSFKKAYEAYGEKMLLITPDLMPESLASYAKAKILHRPLFPNKMFNKILQIVEGPKKSTKNEINRTIKKSIEVLIADDNLINRKLMQEILKKIGAKPHLASNADEALKLFENLQIDMVFMDEIMPGSMNGSDAIRKIRTMKKGRKIPIYSLTGSSSEETVNKIKDAGATDVLFKPVKNSLLERLVHNYSYSD